MARLYRLKYLKAAALTMCFLCVFFLINYKDVKRMELYKPLPRDSLFEHMTIINKHTAENHTLQETLAVLSKDGLIYLASVDSSYVAMGINLYETSFKKFGIQNYLFACSDTKAHKILSERDINSYDFIHDKDSDTASRYHSKAFKRKTHLKTRIVLEGLEANLTVILVDVDIVFLKDPFPFLDCKDCDIQIQGDLGNGNSGFYMARPSKPSIELHHKAWKRAVEMGEVVSNQAALNKYMAVMIDKKEIKVQTLSTDLFVPGCVYFEDGVRMFYWDNPPRDEVIIHNNWILTKSAKIYRFKEAMMWFVDSNGYYTDPSRQYLAYENPVDFGDSALNKETDALKAALIIGYILNRTVILPTFTCRDCKSLACSVQSNCCAFNAHYSVATFDSVMEDSYREHVFLDHPLVPSLSKVTSDPYYIVETDPALVVPDAVTVKTPLHPQKGPTQKEILDWFGKNQEPVLRFHSLYHVLSGFNDVPYLKSVEKAINSKADYMQH